MAVTRKKIGQFWILCPFECGLEKYLTIMTEQGKKLILVDQHVVISVDEKEEAMVGTVLSEPILIADLATWKGVK